MTRLDMNDCNSRAGLEKPHPEKQKWVGLARNLGIREPLTVSRGNLFLWTSFLLTESMNSDYLSISSPKRKPGNRKKGVGTRVGMYLRSMYSFWRVHSSSYPRDARHM